MKMFFHESQAALFPKLLDPILRPEIDATSFATPSELTAKASKGDAIAVLTGDGVHFPQECYNAARDAGLLVVTVTDAYAIGVSKLTNDEKPAAEAAKSQDGTDLVDRGLQEEGRPLGAAGLTASE